MYAIRSYYGEPSEVEFPFFGTMAKGEDAYTLVNETFKIGWVVAIYVVGSLSLGLHLAHGFWSAFQTIGWNNTTWLPRLKVIGIVIAVLMGAGFSAIAVAQYLFF